VGDGHVHLYIIAPPLSFSVDTTRTKEKAFFWLKGARGEEETHKNSKGDFDLIPLS
jgi:hypothetical protein